MLQVLSRTAINPSVVRSFLCKIRPVLGSPCFRDNFYTTPVAAARKQNLPKLPVPPLNKTLDKYLKSLVPLLTEQEMQCACEQAKKFEECEGRKLQCLIEEKAKCEKNWLETWWLNTAYLGFRNPVVVYSSPGLVMPLQKFNHKPERLKYTAKLILAVMEFKDLVDNDKIPVEKAGKDELDMSQYGKVLGTCRIPGKCLDTLEYNPASNHIVVAHNNHFFKLDLCNEGKRLTEAQVIKQLARIMCAASDKAPPIGLLTADDRNSWGSAYQKLASDSCNLKSIRTIQQSLFLVCLDGPMPEKCGSGEKNRITIAGEQTVHGGGSEGNGGNRWYDKTVQFVIGCDGIVGMTYEHSPSEGQPIAVMTDFIVKSMGKESCASACEDTGCLPEPEKLCFNDTDVCKELKHAACTMDQLVDDFDLSAIEFKGYGKDFIKAQKLSPDSYLQVSFQLAYYRVYNQPAAHYESAATRKYDGGRTETIRSCTVEAVKFAKIMLNSCAKPEDKVKAMRCAVQAHKAYTMDAANGYGCDRHLLGLRLMAQEQKMELPGIFKNKAYKKSTTFLITSSQVSPKYAGFMCYGATADDGYAFCYNPRNKNIFFGISSYKKSKKTDTKKMEKALVQSLEDMHDVLVCAAKSKM